MGLMSVMFEAWEASCHIWLDSEWKEMSLLIGWPEEIEGQQHCIHFHLITCRYFFFFCCKDFLKWKKREMKKKVVLNELCVLPNLPFSTSHSHPLLLFVFHKLHALVLNHYLLYTLTHSHTYTRHLSLCQHCFLIILVVCFSVNKKTRDEEWAVAVGTE